MDCDSNRELIAYYRSRLHEVVNDPSTDSVVSWSESGKSFIVGDEEEFRKAVHPRECLVHLGFSQSHDQQWEYACPYFMRGQPDLKPQPQDKPIREIETNNKDDGLILFSSLSCYKEICRLVKEEFPVSFSSFLCSSPLFIRDMYLMVDDPSTDSVVSWSESGKSFVVWNESKFLADVVPSCLPYDFKDMTSLTTKFHALGYSKVEESEHWEYTSEFLVRGHPPPPHEDSSTYTPGGLMISPELARTIEWAFASPKAPKQ